MKQMFYKLKNSRVIKNAGWIIVCRVIQSLFGLVVGMLTARYLGPSNYGLINYASSIVAFAVPIMKLGFDSIMVNELINHPEEEGTILGTSLALNVFLSFISMLGVTLFVLEANPGNTVTLIVCILYSISLIPQAIEMVMYWFQARLLSKYVSIVSMIAYIIVSGYKIYLLATGKSVFWFALSQAFDYLIISLALLAFYHKLGGQKYQFSWTVGKRMFSKSKYYIISSLMVSVFSQTDKIMLTVMLNETETGYYSAAATCAGVTSFIFNAIFDSARPVIFESKRKNEISFERNVSILFSIIILLAVLQSIGISALAVFLVKLLYGNEYLQSVSVLRIVAWTGIFSYIGSVRNIWMLAEGKQKYIVSVNLSGAVANVFLNAMLIPIMGAEGAAIASLITQVFSNVIMSQIISPLRRVNKLMLNGCNPIKVYSYIKKDLSD